MLGLHCCAKAFSSCSKWELRFIAVCGLLIVVTSLVVARGLIGCGARLGWPGMELKSPALAGGFLTIGPPGKFPFKKCFILYWRIVDWQWCVSFRCTTRWFTSNKQVSIRFEVISPFMSLQNIEQFPTHHFIRRFTRAGSFWFLKPSWPQCGQFSPRGRESSQAWGPEPSPASSVQGILCQGDWSVQFHCSVMSDSLRPHESGTGQPPANEHLHVNTWLWALHTHGVTYVANFLSDEVFTHLRVVGG